MKLIKVTNMKKVLKTKDGKSYHPSYFVLDFNKMDDGISCRMLVNFPNIKQERRILDCVSLSETKE